MKLQKASRNGKPIDIYIDSFPEKITHVLGFTIDREDKYIISISDRTPHTRRTIGHELAHVFCGHFDENASKKIAEKELEANRYAFRYYVLWRLGLLNRKRRFSI